MSTTTKSAHRQRVVRTCTSLLVVTGVLAGFATGVEAKPKDGGDTPPGSGKQQHDAEIEAAFATDDDGFVPVIVSLSDDSAVLPNEKERHFSAKRDEVLASLDQARLRAVKSPDGAPFVSMHIEHDQYQVLSKLPQVADVTIDGNTSSAATTYFGGAAGQQLPAQWDYTRIRADWTNANGWTGRGMKVAIIDSGVDRNNPYLAGRVVNEACFATNTDGTGACNNGATWQYAQTSSGVVGSAVWSGCTFNYYACSHGTHVAQTAAGSQGVARGASIVAIRAGHKVWDAATNSFTVNFADSDILNALWYVYAVLPKSGIVVAAVNISIGSAATYPSTCNANTPSITEYIRKLRADYSIPTVIAAGNNDNAFGVSWPACISYAVVVGNTTLTASSGGVDAVFGGGSGGSNMSSLVDVLAPGTDICSAVPTFLKANGWDCGWFGTSMAAPQVAGAMAVLTQKRPAATVDQLVAALQKAGPTGGVSVTDSRGNNITRTRINVANAIYYNI